MIVANYIAYILVIIGALNWGLVGIFRFDLVARIFGSSASVGAIIVYVLIALAAVWLVIAPIIGHGVLPFTK